MHSGGWPGTAKGPQDVEEVLGDGDLVVEEILEPQVILAVGEGHEGQQIGQANLCTVAGGPTLSASSTQGG